MTNIFKLVTPDFVHKGTDAIAALQAHDRCGDA